MGEFLVRVATPADADRLWPLLEEADRRTPIFTLGSSLRRAERRRARLVARLLDVERPIIVAYSGIRAVGYLMPPGGEPFVSSSWRGLGVDVELQEYLR
jgi:hypothetical protein